MRAARLTALLGAMKVVTAGACTSLSGLSGGADAGSDASPSDDAGPVMDAAGADAGPDARFCSAGPLLFCDDFDEGQTFDFGWTEDNVMGMGTLGLDESASLSPPRSLTATIPAGGRAFLTRKLDGSGNHVYFAAAIRPVVLSMSAALDVLDLEEVLPGIDRDLIVWMREGSAFVTDTEGLQDGGLTKTTHPLAIAPALGDWHRYELTLDLGSPATLTVKIDGAIAFSGASPVAWDTGSYKLHVGAILAETATDAYDVRLDDVAADLRP